jgi:hypothetical protein
MFATSHPWVPCCVVILIYAQAFGVESDVCFNTAALARKVVYHYRGTLSTDRLGPFSKKHSPFVRIDCRFLDQLNPGMEDLVVHAHFGSDKVITL